MSKYSRVCFAVLQKILWDFLKHMKNWLSMYVLKVEFFLYMSLSVASQLCKKYRLEGFLPEKIWLLSIVVTIFGWK